MVTQISTLTKQELARKLDFSILTHQTDKSKILSACEELREYKYAAIYVLSNYLDLAVNEVGSFCKENDIKIGCGPSFPFGTELTEAKVFHAKMLIKKGCTSMDLMTCIGALKDKDYKYYSNELKQIANLCHANGVICKAITEVCYLTEEEIKISTELVAEAGFDYIKTSTGQGIKGFPSISKDIVMIRKEIERLGVPMKLKVAGVNVPKAQNALCFLAAGVDLIGTQTPKEIVDDLEIIQSLNVFR